MLIGIFLPIAHLLGIISAFHALMGTRTSQGAVAWIVGLISFPVITVPLYWIFGRNKFQGYISARYAQEESHGRLMETIHNKLHPHRAGFIDKPGITVGEQLAQLPFLKGNDAQLLIDGDQTFDSIMAGIEQADEYILLQFYIIHDDGLGQRFKQGLLDKAAQGIKIYLLYDEIGSNGLPAAYINELKDAGVAIHSFHSTRGARNRFQINFRNHRKVVVVDGSSGWVGGLNVGDEYLGKSAKFGPWRDTFVKITGPAVLQLQLSFVEDYHWATDTLLDFKWEPQAAPGGEATILILPSGPSDTLETASLMYQQAILSAQKRIWIASPYFIPDLAVLSALHLAALRNVEVRILIPDKSDKYLVYFSAYAFVGKLLDAGIEFYRYRPGFLHEKVFLVDDRLAGIGTANFDNRSFRLNFEITSLIVDETLVKGVEQMFINDFQQSFAMDADEVRNKPWWFKILARASYLTAPIQ